MDKIALRLAESNVLRAEAAIEKMQAKRTREGRQPLGYDDDESSEPYAVLHEAKAELLLAQAAWVEYSNESDRTRLLAEWLQEEHDRGSDKVFVKDIMHILEGRGKP